MRKVFMAVFAFAVIALMSFAAVAQDGTAVADASDVFDLGEIVVSGTSFSMPQASVPGEVTSDDFQRLGVQNVPQALNLLPGVRVTVGQKNEPAITIRGFDQDKVLVLLDGIPMQDAYYNKLDLASIPLESIAKITVTTGPSSSLYGANAMGGVVSIVTKKSEQKPNGRIVFGGGDDSSSNTQLSYGGSFGKYYMFLAASYQETDGFTLSRSFIPTSPATSQTTALRRLNSDFKKSHYSLKVGKNTKRNDEYAASFTFTESERGVPVHAYSPTSVSKFSRYARFTEWKSYTIDLSAQQNVSKKSTIREMLYYHKYDNTYESFSNKTFLTYFNATTNSSVYDDHSMGFRVLADTVKYGGPLKVAFSYNQDVHNAHAYLTAPTWSESKTHTASLGVEKLFKAGKRWDIIPGASYDAYAPETTGIKKYAFNPQVNFIYNLDENNKWHFTAAKKTRFPTQNQLFSSSSGNTGLEPSTSESYEAGVVSQISQRLSGSLTVFYNDIEDLIEKDTTGINQNISSAMMSGVEIKFSKSCNGKACGSIGFSSLRARNRFTGTPLEKTAKGKIDLDMTFPLPKKIDFNVSSTYMMSRYETITATNKTVKPYLLINTGLSGKIPCVNSEWRVFVDNITDKNYEQEYGFPQAGRTYKAELQYNF